MPGDNGLIGFASFKRRLQALDGKAMVVCISRRIRVDRYNELIKFRPDWASASDDDIDQNNQVGLPGWSRSITLRDR